MSGGGKADYEPLFKTCQRNFISFFDKITRWEDERNKMDIVCLDLKKAFDNLLFVSKLEKHGLDTIIKRWILTR